LAPHLAFSVSELLVAQDPEFLDDVARIQPTVFALQIAIARALYRFGIYPDAVIGHSMGEVAAAHLAGILSLADAAHVIALRSRLLAETAGSGGMVATGLS
jgi:acyl transferase domain-containing protein